MAILRVRWGEERVGVGGFCAGVCVALSTIVAGSGFVSATTTEPVEFPEYSVDTRCEDGFPIYELTLGPATAEAQYVLVEGGADVVDATDQNQTREVFPVDDGDTVGIAGDGVFTFVAVEDVAGEPVVSVEVSSLAVPVLECTSGPDTEFPSFPEFALTGECLDGAAVYTLTIEQSTSPARQWIDVEGYEGGDAGTSLMPSPTEAVVTIVAPVDDGQRNVGTAGDGLYTATASELRGEGASLTTVGSTDTPVLDCASEAADPDGPILPETGSTSRPLTLIALASVAVGLALVATTNLRRRTLG